MAHSVKEITSGAAKAAGSVREALQGFLVPELRSIKVSIESLQTEMHLRDEQLRREMQIRGEQQTGALNALREELRLRTESLAQEIRSSEQRQTQVLQILSEKLDIALNVRERLILLEARLPKR